MIASLTGIVERSEPGQVVLNVHGVGYLVSVPMPTFMRLPGVGETARLSVITVVREDEISLYGFSSEGEERLFNLLREVTGVGPKLALKILSGMDARRLSEAIGGGDAAMLATLPGVGKKLAQRLIVELREKVGSIPTLDSSTGAVRAGPVSTEAMEALAALGYPPRVAKRAVEESIADGLGVEDVVKAALKRLAPKR